MKALDIKNIANQSQPRSAIFFSFKSIAAIGLFLCLGAASLWHMSRLDSKSMEEYSRLMSVFDPSADPEPISYQAKQNKSHLQKDIILIKNGEPLHLRLRARDSQLVYDQQPDGVQMIEKMHGVNCVMQEELYYILPDGREVVRHEKGIWKMRHTEASDPSSFVSLENMDLKPMQVIRYLEAEDAAYYYKDDLCIANEVSFSRYAHPGHDLVENFDSGKLLMDGIADKIEFSLSAHLTFKVYGMRASFFKNKGNGE